jgi:hypothetical protein
MSEPFTTGFGAVPVPEEPQRPGYGGVYPSDHPMPAWRDEPHPHWNDEPQPYWQAPPSPGPAASSSVVNQIRIGGGYRRCNHVLHAALTLLTCGLWAPVWFVAWLVSRQYR